MFPRLFRVLKSGISSVDFIGQRPNLVAKGPRKKLQFFFHRGPIIRSLSIERGHGVVHPSPWINHLPKCVNLEKFRCQSTDQGLYKEIASLKNLTSLDFNVSLANNQLIYFLTGKTVVCVTSS
jgi:hypothetical protein